MNPNVKKTNEIPIENNKISYTKSDRFINIINWTFV